MSYEPVPRDQWASFFDSFSRTLGGVRVEIEVMGLDLGDQIEAEWRPLNGLTYEPKTDSLYVYIEGVDDRIDHVIVGPQEVWAELGPTGLDSVVVMDRDGHKQIVRFQAPLELPPGAFDTIGQGPSPA